MRGDQAQFSLKHKQAPYVPPPALKISIPDADTSRFLENGFHFFHIAREG
jgi:hypothetical protein